ncbi:MAG: hypothetical protein K6T59_11310 [Bryobacteraceae bacterium]|nr:hypothetical protein [Bryobacteraceae bacterium]
MKLGVLMLASVLALSAATFKLYLKDGGYHLVREYQLEGDRVRYYSIERSEWEEIPAALVDLERTQAELQRREQRIRQETQSLAEEEQAERELRQEIARVPGEAGVYWVRGAELRALKQAESKIVTNRRRTLLKVLTPVPVVAGKATVELDGPTSATVVDTAMPEFYIRLAADERFGIFRLTPNKEARVVQRWSIIPVTQEIFEEQEEVEVFRRQVGEGLYKIWPKDPLPPGEYAVVEYTAGKGKLQVWDFAYRP